MFLPLEFLLMAVAKTVVDYLDQRAVPYTIVTHSPTPSTRDIASRTHLPPESIAKGVVLWDQHGYVMAVLPANRYLNVHTLNRKLKRDLRLADEQALRRMFRDCALGAIPPLGPAYGMPTVVDDHLVGQAQIYFEAGDHEELIRVSGEEFIALLRNARYAAFTH